MTQPTLFELHREPLAQARTTDPPSSKAAADAVNQSGTAEHQRQRVIDLVYMHPGSTSKELAAKCDDLDRFQVARRLPEAERTGVIRRKQIGTNELTWWPK